MCLILTPLDSSYPFVVYTDGATKGRNGEGPASSGFVAKDRDGNHLFTCATHIGIQTNNFAEYQGLIMALNWAENHIEKKFRSILFRTDSQLMERQLNGFYAIKHPVIMQQANLVKTKLLRLKAYKIEWVPREYNSEADKACNEAITLGHFEVGSSWRVEMMNYEL